MKITSFMVFLFLAINTFAQDFIQGPYQNYSMVVPLIADFDGDENLDVLGRQFGLVVLQINDGTTPISFTEKSLSQDFDFAGRADTADMDQDNDIDVIVAQGTELHLVMLKNDGMANFTLDSLGVSGANVLKTIDIDNDTDLDIVGMNFLTQSVYIYLNDGNQNFTTQTIVENSTNLEVFDVADMDGDSDMDIVLGYDQFSGDQIVLVKNNGGNNFETINILSDPFSSLGGLKIEDIDGDGKNDVLAFKSFSCTAFINQGNDTYEGQSVASASDIIRSIQTGDYNGDGKKDIILGTNSNDILWFENNSTTTLSFESGVVVGGVAPCFSITNGDLDKDDDIDIVVSNGEFWWYENDLMQGVSTLDFSKQTIDVFPNPFLNFVQIQNLENESFDFEIHTILGEKIFANQVVSDKIDLSKLKKGTYSLTLINKKTKESKSTLIMKSE